MALPETEPLGVLEALHSTPSRRFLSPEPIPDEVIWAILDAAVRGPSGGNQQGWGWVVVTDPAIKSRVGEWYREGWDAAYGRRRPTSCQRYSEMLLRLERSAARGSAI